MEIHKLSLKDAKTNKFIDNFIEKTSKERVGNRDLALAGLAYQFMLQENCTVDEIELCEQTKWEDNNMTTSWFVRRREINYDI